MKKVSKLGKVDTKEMGIFDKLYGKILCIFIHRSSPMLLTFLLVNVSFFTYYLSFIFLTHPQIFFSYFLVDMPLDPLNLDPKLIKLLKEDQ